MEFVEKVGVVDAVQFTKEMNEGVEPLPAGAHFKIKSKKQFPYVKRNSQIFDLKVGDWILTDRKGKQLVCSNDYFLSNYEMKKQSRLNNRSMIEYMRDFLANNDQLPTRVTIANEFDVFPNAIQERIERLEKKGVFVRNSIGNIMFTRDESKIREVCEKL